MHPDWDYVKKSTLWQYEDLVKKLNIIEPTPSSGRPTTTI